MTSNRRIITRLGRMTVKEPMSANAYRNEAHKVLRRYNLNDSNFYHFIVEMVENSILQLSEDGRVALRRAVKRYERIEPTDEHEILKNRIKYDKKEHRSKYYE